MANIDYGLGTTNIDTTTGIRYGVISQHSLAEWFFDEFEAQYGEPHCPECGEVVGYVSDIDYNDTDYTKYRQHGCDDLVCHTCKHTIDSAYCFPDEPIGHELKDEEYHAIDCLDSDVMILRSPYYTYAPFCSPCVPGAGNLDDAMPDWCEPHGVKTYCFGHDYFEDHKAPYKVFRVADDTEVLPCAE